ncbi:MAG: hypothetical protein ACRDT1_15385, partial [Micromonosporaceae bacterium]
PPAGHCVVAGVVHVKAVRYSPDPAGAIRGGAPVRTCLGEHPGGPLSPFHRISSDRVRLTPAFSYEKPPITHTFLEEFATNVVDLDLHVLRPTGAPTF